MPLILSILLGLIFALVIGVMALGIVAFARDHCDETLDPNQPTSPQMPPSRPSPGSSKFAAPARNSGRLRPRDSRGRFIKKTPSRP